MKRSNLSLCLHSSPARGSFDLVLHILIPNASCVLKMLSGCLPKFYLAKGDQWG